MKAMRLHKQGSSLVLKDLPIPELDFPLKDANIAMDKLRNGEIQGAAVLVNE